MTSHIRFYRDGVLRRHASAYNYETKEHESAFLPVKAWEQAVDPHTFLKSLHSVISFEDGLTVAELFQNLKPWQDVMTGVACMDFPAFVSESEKPSKPDDKDHLSHIVLQYYCSLRPVPAFERDEELFSKRKKDGFFRLKVGKPIVTDRLQLEAGWHNENYLKTPKYDENAGFSYDSVSLDFSPLDEWSHLPISIETKSKFVDYTPSDRCYLSTRKSVTRGDNPLAIQQKNSSNKVISNAFSMEAPTPTFFDCLVRGFFWNIGFSYSPAGRDRQIEDIKESIEEVDEIKAGKEPSKSRMDSYESRRMAEYEWEKSLIEKTKSASASMGLEIKPNIKWNA